MPEFIDHGIKEIRDSTSPEEITVLVGCNGDRDELDESIQAIGGCVDDHIGRTTLVVSIPESEIDQLCEIESVISVERDETDVVPQNSENFTRQTDSMM